MLFAKNFSVFSVCVRLKYLLGEVLLPLIKSMSLVFVTRDYVSIVLGGKSYVVF